jgi:hypothetical protein
VDAGDLRGADAGQVIQAADVGGQAGGASRYQPPLASAAGGRCTERRIATGKFSASDPYVKESMVLLKQLFDSCATKNWSGITGLSGD